MRVKMSKQPPPAPTASAVGPCPTAIQSVGRPGTGSLPSTIAPPDHPWKRTSKSAKYRFATTLQKRPVKISMYLGLDNIIKLKFTTNFDRCAY